MLVLVKVQPLKEKGDANRAHMETDHQIGRQGTKPQDHHENIMKIQNEQL